MCAAAVLCAHLRIMGRNVHIFILPRLCRHRAHIFCSIGLNKDHVQKSSDSFDFNANSRIYSSQSGPEQVWKDSFSHCPSIL